MASAVPPEWTDDDLLPASEGWFGVRVAEYDEPEDAEESLGVVDRSGWGPIALVPRADGLHALVIGEFASPAPAWFLAEELEAIHFGHPRVIHVPDESDPPSGTGTFPRGVDGPFLPTFLPSRAPDVEALSLQALVEETLPSIDDEADRAEAAAFLRDWRRGEVETNDVGHGAAIVARKFWAERQHPEETLFLAGRVARGEWQAPHGLRLEMQDVMAELLHGYRRDWRAAWSASEWLYEQHGRPRDGLRLLALELELIAEGRTPSPAFPEVRSRLARLYEEAGPEADIRPRIEWVYLQTFAWEGDWARVERVADGFLTRHGGSQPYAALAEHIRARSLLRDGRNDEAHEAFERLAEIEFPEEQHLRFGVTLTDPADRLRHGAGGE